MTETKLVQLSHDKLSISPRFDGTKLEVCLSGCCDSFSVTSLGAYLDQIGLELRRLGLPGVSINITRLTLLNSSSFKQFIRFLHPIKLGQFKCVVEFVVDEQCPWQRRSLAALARMCPAGVTVREEGAGASAGNPSRKLTYASTTPEPR